MTRSESRSGQDLLQWLRYNGLGMAHARSRSAAIAVISAELRKVDESEQTDFLSGVVWAAIARRHPTAVARERLPTPPADPSELLSILAELLVALESTASHRPDCLRELIDEYRSAEKKLHDELKRAVSAPRDPSPEPVNDTTKKDPPPTAASGPDTVVPTKSHRLNPPAVVSHPPAVDPVPTREKDDQGRLDRMERLLEFMMQHLSTHAQTATNLKPTQTETTQPLKSEDEEGDEEKEGGKASPIKATWAQDPARWDEVLLSENDVLRMAAFLRRKYAKTGTTAGEEHIIETLLEALEDEMRVVLEEPAVVSIEPWVESKKKIFARLDLQLQRKRGAAPHVVAAMAAAYSEQDDPEWMRTTRKAAVDAIKAGTASNGLQGHQRKVQDRRQNQSRGRGGGRGGRGNQRGTDGRGGSESNRDF
jgi:hypothetical protein